MLALFDPILGELNKAIASDLQSLSANPQFKRNLAFQASQLTGFDLTKGPLGAMFESQVNKQLEKLQKYVDTAAGFPEETAEMMKEQAEEKINDFAAALAARKAKKERENG